MARPVIVTGAAGFIGMHVAQRLLDRGETVVGVDVFNAYYDPRLKEARAARLEGRDGFRMVRLDIAEHGRSPVLRIDNTAAAIRGWLRTLPPGAVRFARLLVCRSGFGRCGRRGKGN